jgi:hypothetical protein
MEIYRDRPKPPHVLNVDTSYKRIVSFRLEPFWHQGEPSVPPHAYIDFRTYKDKKLYNYKKDEK